jgi:hypothetical protein
MNGIFPLIYILSTHSLTSVITTKDGKQCLLAHGLYMFRYVIPVCLRMTANAVAIRAGLTLSRYVRLRGATNRVGISKLSFASELAFHNYKWVRSCWAQKYTKPVLYCMHFALLL